MNNKYMSYKNIELWNTNSWDERRSCLIPLGAFMEESNYNLIRKPDKTPVDPSLYVDGKTHAVTFPEVVEYWEQKGMKYFCHAMMEIRWAALIPQTHFEDTSKKIDAVLVLHDSDKTDPRWAMDMMEYYKQYNEAAAKSGIAIIYVVMDNVDPTGMFTKTIQEAVSLFHFNFKNLYLDLSPLSRVGKKLSEVPGFTLCTNDGAPVSDTDSHMETLASLNIPVLNINDIWPSRTSLTQSLSGEQRASNAKFDVERFIHRQTGKKGAEGLWLEHHFSDAYAPGVVDFFDAKGLKYEMHDKKGENWISFVPKAAFEEKEKLPVVLIMQEVCYANKHMPLTAISYFYEYMDIAAQGDCILIFFALETLDDNDLLMDILDDAGKLYPIDMQRVYVTGQSHNGHYAYAISRRHRERIAAVVTMGDDFGIAEPECVGKLFRIEDDELERMHGFDMPTCNISGATEHSSFIPLSTDAPDFRPGYFNTMSPFERRAKSWQRRLYACNCPEKSFDDILATKTSSDYVERKLGIPSDKTECLYLDGEEHYIADIKNNSGKNHLRVVAAGNTPHTVTASMVNLGWSFLRRFARDLKTGEVIELY